MYFTDHRPKRRSSDSPFESMDVSSILINWLKSIGDVAWTYWDWKKYSWFEES